jgi:hypothetical protein
MMYAKNLYFNVFSSFHCSAAETAVGSGISVAWTAVVIETTWGQEQHVSPSVFSSPSPVLCRRRTKCSTKVLENSEKNDLQ